GPQTVLGVQHRVQGRLEVGQHTADLGQVLLVVGRRVEDVQDQGGEEAGGALVPEAEVACLQPQRVDQDADNVLDVGDLHAALADLEQRVPADSIGIGRVELDAVGK